MEGLLSESVCKRTVQVRTEPITDFYTVEARPFARGKFANVRRCRQRTSGVEYAAKYMRKRRRASDVRHEILHEAHVLELSCKHPHIVRMHEVYETPSEIILLLELVPGGELQRVLDDEEVVEEEQAKKLLRQILDGVSFLHQHNIAHLDLKPQNLLLTKPFPEGEVKLCDFGISRLITKGIEIREIVGTPDYVAPEVLHYEPISLPTDMWSLGILTYVLLSGHSPFGGETKQETFCNITRGTLDFPPDLFSGISNYAKDFIQRLLVRNPNERMTAKECLNHPWLSEGQSTLPGIQLTLSPESISHQLENSSSDDNSLSPVHQDSKSSVFCDNQSSKIARSLPKVTCVNSPLSNGNEQKESYNGSCPELEQSILSPNASESKFLRSPSKEYSSLLAQQNNNEQDDIDNGVCREKPPLNATNGLNLNGTGDSSREDIGGCVSTPCPQLNDAIHLIGLRRDMGSLSLSSRVTRISSNSFTSRSSGLHCERDKQLSNSFDQSMHNGKSLSSKVTLSSDISFTSSHCHSKEQTDSLPAERNEAFSASFKQSPSTGRKDQNSRMVAQFEGISKRMIFSEDICVDERISMVY